MKKLLVCVAALGMLFTSCMRDETRLDEGSIVTFKISAPAVSTRAAIEGTYGTGVEADDLHWAIFEQDENGNPTGAPIFDNVEDDFFAGDKMENTFNARLVKGKKYVGVFWAQDDEAPYTVDWATQTVTMNETVSNNEKLDAFFNIHKFAITAGQETGEQQVELRRPFAQLNVAVPATDLAAAKAAGFELAKTGITLNVAKSFSLVTGAVGTTEDVTYTLANIPTDVTATLEGTEYQLVSFNYILVDAGLWDRESQAWTENTEKDLTDVTFNYGTADFNYGTADETLSQTFQNITVQRNHRTYIVGSLLSETVDFRVIILPDWEDPYYLNNMEAGTIELVAEQTKASNTGLGVATITWNAVEGAAYYGVEYKGEELDQVLPDGSTRADEEATAPAILSYTTEPNTVEGASGTFTIKAYNENDKVIARVVTESIPVFSLAKVRKPEMVIENNVLKINKTYDLTGAIIDLKVDFKDKEGVVKYSAFHSKQNGVNDYTTTNQINSGRFTFAQYGFFLMDGKTWTWTLADGSTVNSTTLPEMAAGEYTVEYTATYYAILNGYWAKKISSNPSVYGPADGEADSDRVMFDGKEADVCTATEPITGKLGTYKVAGFGGTVTAVAEGYQGAKLTWDAAEDAVKYEIYANGEKVSEVENATEATVTGLDKAREYTFTIKAYNAQGAKLAGEPASAEIEIYTLFNRPVPEMSLENGVLTVATDLDHASFMMGNVHIYGPMLAAEVYFYKDGATTPAYTAYSDPDVQGTANGKTVGQDYPAAIDIAQPYMKAENMAVQFTKWQWAEGDGAFGEATTTAPTFAPGTYTAKIKGYYFPTLGGQWAVSGALAENYASANRIFFTKILMSNYQNKKFAEAKSSATLRTDDIAGSIEVGFKAEAVAAADILNISWNPIAGATYEVFVNSSLVGETTDASYAYEAKAIGDYNVEVKVKNTELSATASAKVEYLFAAFWTAPKFSFTGKRLMVTELMNIDNATHFGYAYGGMANTASGKSTIEIYKDGTLLYTLTNGTAQSNLNSWAGWKRWAFKAQDNRQDWVWTKPDGTIISVDPNDATRLEADVPEGTLTAGNYTLKWTIGYVVTKNTYWSDDTNNQMTTKEGASRMYFDGGLNDVYGVGGQVATVSKTGETTLTVQ